MRSALGRFALSRQTRRPATYPRVVLDFKELPDDGNGFELMIRELLFSRGYRVYWSGRGPDGGRDLLAIESGHSALGAKERKWVVSCKHFAHADRAVGVTDLGEIRDTCEHHQADAFLLVCSTYRRQPPRLEGIDHDRATRIATHYWDGAFLERLLSAPAGWSIAQRFMPESTAGWRVWGTEVPNRWIGNYRGHVTHIANRVGSSPDFTLQASRVGSTSLRSSMAACLSTTSCGCARTMSTTSTAPSGVTWTTSARAPRIQLLPEGTCIDPLGAARSMTVSPTR